MSTPLKRLLKRKRNFLFLCKTKKTSDESLRHHIAKIH
jgi:hypothetical protein